MYVILVLIEVISWILALLYVDKDWGVVICSGLIAVFVLLLFNIL